MAVVVELVGTEQQRLFQSHQRLLTPLRLEQVALEQTRKTQEALLEQTQFFQALRLTVAAVAAVAIPLELLAVALAVVVFLATQQAPLAFQVRALGVEITTLRLADKALPVVVLQRKARIVRT
jgi:hypothetical protein